MNKYLAIIDHKTFALTIVCVVVTYLCDRYQIAYDFNITLFSVAVIFPLVFTIREAFKRRDSALKFLSLFKASMGSVHYSFEQCRKLDERQHEEVTALLQEVSVLFFRELNSPNTKSEPVQQAVNEVFYFIQRNKASLRGNLILKIIRFMQDVNESIENTISVKIHGTPISMRAYCLVFVFLFPFVFSPTIIYNVPSAPMPLTYGLAILHGFILISLYNVQEHLENPFDEVGLDDIQMHEYRFQRADNPALAQSQAVLEAPDSKV